jgi:hypothetical protein
MAERVVPLNVPPIVASQRTSSRQARRPDHRQACANSTGQSLGTTKPKVSTQRRHVGRPRKRARSMGRRPPNCVRSSPISTHSGAGRRLLIRSCRGVALASSADGRRAWPEAGSVDRQKLAAGRAACVLGTCNGPAVPNHPAGKRKDQTQGHPTPTLASQNSRSRKSNRMRQNLP